jgi:Rad3-related DNA helicase
MPEKNTDRILDLILGQLEKLNENQEKLSEEIQKTNLELAKIAGLRHAVSDFNKWKENIDKVVNADDLGKIKEFYTKHQDIDSSVEDLFLITKELRESSDDYNKFKVKTMTVIAVISFLFTTALTVLGIMSKWSH